MDHVHAELRRIRARLLAPEPNEHAGLYAAQQALNWALNPSQYAPPFRTVTGILEEPEGCCAGIDHQSSGETGAQMSGGAQLQ